MCDEYVDVALSDDHVVAHKTNWTHEKVYGNEKYCYCRVCNELMSVRLIIEHLKSIHPRPNVAKRRLETNKDVDVIEKRARNVSMQELLNVLVPLCEMLRSKCDCYSY